MTKINLKVEGSIKTVQFVGAAIRGASGDGTISITDFTMGEFSETDVQIITPSGNGWVVMTQRQYDNIVAFMDEEVVYDADTEIEFPETNAQLKADINAQGNSIVSILGTNAEQDKRIARLEAEDGTIYTKWVVRGTEFQCETDNRDDGYASVDLANGFIGKSHPISPDDDSDSSQLLRIKTPLGVLTIKTAVLELGKVRDAVNNGSDEAVHSAVHPTT
ncbi:MAG: hypothetical protein K0U41_06600 [Gammaproteobacteria bacterium]|nr:hypothetical protein [Gammaproteobacteria bacterium]